MTLFSCIGTQILSFAIMAKTISGKFKQLRVGLKQWSKELSKLNKLINNCSWVLALLDGLEEKA